MRTDARRCRPSSGCSLSTRPIASRIREVTVVRAFSAGSPGAARPAAEAVRPGQLGHQEVALLGDPGGRVVVAVGLGVGEPLVEVVQPLPVRRPRTVVEYVAEVALPGRRPRRRTDQVEDVHLRPGLREQPREVGHPLHRG